jgi:PAS domain S-box-containing protein
MSESKEQNITESWFQESPAAMLALDAEGRIVQANREMQTLLGVTSEELLGHSAETLPFAHLRGLFEPGEFHIMGVGEEGRTLHCSARPLPEPEGTVIHCYQENTELRRLQEENRQLRRQLEELAITDEETGLTTRRTLSRTLELHVTRSRRYHNPLSLAVIEIGLSDPEASLTNELVIAVGRFLRDRLRWVDMIARWDDGQFVMVLPETSIEDGQLLLAKIQEGFYDNGVFENVDRGSFCLYIGLAEWQKGNDARMLMQRAIQSLSAQKATDQAATA